MTNLNVRVENLEYSKDKFEAIDLSAKYKGETYHFAIDDFFIEYGNLTAFYEPEERDVGANECYDIDEDTIKYIVEVNHIIMIPEADDIDITEENREVYDEMMKEGLEEQIKDALIDEITKNFVDDMEYYLLEHCDDDYDGWY